MPPILPLLLAVAITLAITPAIARGQQPPPAWPAWMGADHNGISAESGWSSDWPESGLEVVWTQELGIGFSSVSITDGRLYSMGHVEGEEFVYCLDAVTGKEIWTHKYPCELVDVLYEGGPGATPTIDGPHVYTLGKEGQLFCFDAKNGNVVWQQDLQTDLDVSLPEWGFNSSPYILGDQLLLEAGRVVSYDKHSGEKNWQTEKHQAGYGTVALLNDNERQLIASLDSESLRITDASDGSPIDAFPWKSPFRTNSTTPIVSDGTIYVSTGYNVGCGLFQFKDDKLELVYSNRFMRNHFNNSILYDGHLYGFDGNSNLGRVVQLVCMNQATGEVVWKHRGLGCGSLMIVDGKLLLLSDNGELVLANATPEGYQEIATSPFLEGRCWTVPVLFGGHVYGRNAAGKLVCARLP